MMIRFAHAVAARNSRNAAEKMMRTHVILALDVVNN